MPAGFALVVRAATAVGLLALFHAAIVTDSPVYNVATVSVLLAAALSRGVRGSRRRLALAGSLCVMALALLLLPRTAAMLVHGLPTLANLGLMIYFGRT